MTSKMSDHHASQSDHRQSASPSKRRSTLEDDTFAPPSRSGTISRAQSVRSRAGTGTFRTDSPASTLHKMVKSRTRYVTLEIPSSTPRLELVRAANALKIEIKDLKSSEIDILRRRIKTYVACNFKPEMYLLPELKNFWCNQSGDPLKIKREWIQPAANETVVLTNGKPKPNVETVRLRAGSIRGKEKETATRKALANMNINNDNTESEHDADGEAETTAEPQSHRDFEESQFTASTPLRRVKSKRTNVEDFNESPIEEKFNRLFRPSAPAPRAPPSSPRPNDVVSWEAFHEQKRAHQAGIDELNSMLRALADEMRDIDDVLIEQSAEMVANRADLDHLEKIAESAFTHAERSRDVLASAAERIEQFKKDGSDLRSRIEHVTMGESADLEVLRQRFYSIQRSAHDALETVKRNHKRLNVAIAGIPMTRNTPMEDAAYVLKKLEFVPIRGQYAAWRRYGDREDGLPFDENQPPFLIIRFPTEFVVMDLLKKFNSYRNMFADRKAPFKVMKDLTKKQVLDAKKVNEVIVRWRKDDGRDYRNRDGVIYLFENGMKVRKIGIEEGPLGPLGPVNRDGGQQAPTGGARLDNRPPLGHIGYQTHHQQYQGQNPGQNQGQPQLPRGFQHAPPFPFPHMPPQFPSQLQGQMQGQHPHAMGHPAGFFPLPFQHQGHGHGHVNPERLMSWRPGF